MSSPKSPLPFSKRPIDILFIVWFIVYFITVMISDYHNFTASHLGLHVRELEKIDFGNWPPRFVTQLYLRWCEDADPLLYENPPFFQAMEWINLLFLLPFSLFAVLGFSFGWESIRQTAFVTSSCVLFSIVLCAGESLYGEFVSPDPILFLAMYTPYVVFPILVVLRLWNDHPFTSSGLPGAFTRFLIWLFSSVTFGYFFVAMYFFLVKHLPSSLNA